MTLLLPRCDAFSPGTADDSFPTGGPFSPEEFLRRLSKYEGLCGDLAILLACIAYWAKATHKTILQKSLARSTDRLEIKAADRCGSPCAGTR